MIFEGKKVPKIATQNACELGEYEESSEFPDFDKGIVQLDYMDIIYRMPHGIGKIKVPAESTGRYKKALKGKITYQEFEYELRRLLLWIWVILFLQ